MLGWSQALLLGTHTRVCVCACVSEDPFPPLGMLGGALPSHTGTWGCSIGGSQTVGWAQPPGWGELPAKSAVPRGPGCPAQPLSVLHASLEGSLEVLTEA